MSKKPVMANIDFALVRMSGAPNATILFPKFDYDEIVGYTKGGWAIERSHYKYVLGVLEYGQPAVVANNVTLYPADMAWLLQGGYIRSVLLFPHGDSGRPEVYYRITAKGEKLAREEAAHDENFALSA